MVEAVDVFALGRSVNCLALCEPLVYRGQRPRSHTVSSSHGGWGGGGAAHKVGPLASHLSHASMQTLATQASMLAGNDRRRLLFPAVAPSREAAAAERHLRGASRSWLDGASELFASLSMGPAAGKVAFHQTRANLLVATAPAYADACAAHLGWGLPSAAAAAAAVVTHAANASGGLAHAGENCHAACQGVPGSCPGFCGGGGACCKRGTVSDGEACGLGAVGCDGFHCCAAAAASTVVAAVVAHAGENCHAACQGVPGSCPGFCGGGGACCKRGTVSDGEACGLGAVGCDGFHCCCAAAAAASRGGGGGNGGGGDVGEHPGMEMEGGGAVARGAALQRRRVRLMRRQQLDGSAGHGDRSLGDSPQSGSGETNTSLSSSSTRSTGLGRGGVFSGGGRGRSGNGGGGGARRLLAGLVVHHGSSHLEGLHEERHSSGRASEGAGIGGVGGVGVGEGVGGVGVEGLGNARGFTGDLEARSDAADPVESKGDSAVTAVALPPHRVSLAAPEAAPPFRCPAEFHEEPGPGYRICRGDSGTGEWVCPPRWFPLAVPGSEAGVSCAAAAPGFLALAPGAAMASAAAASPPCTMHTYFQPMTSYFDTTKAEKDGNEETIAAWRKAWESRGWSTRVLNEADAKPHPDFAHLKAAFNKLPTVTKKCMNTHKLKAGAACLLPLPIMHTK